jgi:hypothetical protein
MGGGIPSIRRGGVVDRLTHPLVPAVAFAVAAVGLGIAVITHPGSVWVAGLLWLVFAANAGYGVSGSV